LKNGGPAEGNHVLHFSLKTNSIKESSKDESWSEDLRIGRSSFPSMVRIRLEERNMFTHSAQLYDKLYSFKNYAAEADRLATLIREHVSANGLRLLDVACGTGGHLTFLKNHFLVEGLDLSAELIDVARERNPAIPFHCADMVSFDLNRRFDVVTCLFSSIGYVKTLPSLDRAVRTMVGHLVPGGILIIEPWFTPETWHPGKVHAQHVDETDLKITRMNTSCAEGRLSWFEFHYLVGTPAGVSYFTERHELGLFSRAEMTDTLQGAGLEVTYDENGLSGRGLYLGKRGRE
jgi:ubiquinone/menaquinone biosynthesis C-methylase UbiE